MLTKIEIGTRVTTKDGADSGTIVALGEGTVIQVKWDDGYLSYEEPRSLNDDSKRSETMTKQQALSVKILTKISEGMTAAEAMDAVFGPGTFDKLASEVYDALQPGLKGYHPEMGEEKPAAQIEAQLSHDSQHYYLKSLVELKGRGIIFIRTLTTGDLTPAAQGKVGWHEYMVTTKAFDAICEKHAVAFEMLLS